MQGFSENDKNIFFITIISHNHGKFTPCRDISGAVFSPEPGANRTVEEEAFRLAIDQINDDNKNYPDIKLRGLVRFADPMDDFDNIEKGKES